MTNTANYNLKKPDGTDVVDISVINSNFDTIDTTIKGVANSIPSSLPANGGNAATVGGHPSTDFAPSGFGLGTNSTDISSQNLNNYQTTGFFKGNSVTNAPNSGWFWFIVQAHDGGNWTNQIAVSFGASNTGNIMYIRTNANGTWSTWSQLAKTTDIPTSTSQLSNNSGFITASSVPVQNVNGKTGSVNLSYGDVGAAAASHSHSVGQVSGLATVATSGNYNDLSNKPAIPTVPDLSSYWNNSNCPSSVGTTGYQKSTNGFIMQWGQANYVGGPYSGSGSNVTFPVTFPNKCIGVFIQQDSFLGTYVVYTNSTSYTKGTTNSGMFICFGTNGASSTTYVPWLAIGY